MSWTNRNYERDKKDTTEILEFLLDRIESDIECFADVAGLLREIREFDNKYWISWQRQEILSDSIGVSVQSATGTWIREGFEILLIKTVQTGKGVLMNDIDLSRPEIPNEEWYLEYNIEMKNIIADLRQRTEQPAYLIQQFGRSILKTRAEALDRLHKRLIAELKQKRRERWLQTDLNPAKVEEYIRDQQEKYTDNVTLRKRLLDRGNWKMNTPLSSDLEGVQLVQYREPREKFIPDSPDQPQMSKPSTWISMGLYSYLIRRLFKEERVSSYDELEQKIKEKTKTGPDSLEIFTANMSDHAFFVEDGEYMSFVQDRIEDQVGSLRSRPVFRDFMFPYDAVILSRDHAQIVEFENELGALNISVIPGEKANLGVRFKGDPTSVNRSDAIISVRARIGIPSRSEIGTAYIVDNSMGGL